MAANIRLSQVDTKKLTAPQRLLIAQQLQYVKVGVKENETSGRSKKAFRYIHKSKLTVAALKKEFGTEPDYLVDQFNVVLWPDEWSEKCQSRPWHYFIVPKERETLAVDALRDSGFSGETRILVKNVSPQVHTTDLVAWLRVGILTQDPAFRNAQRQTKITHNKLDGVAKKLKNLPFRRTEARTEEDAKVERELIRKALIEERFQWEEDVKAYEKEMTAAKVAVQQIHIHCVPGPIDPLHRTVTWYVMFPGKHGRSIADLAVYKTDWYGVTLARGIPMDVDAVMDLAYKLYAARSRKAVTRRVVKEAGIATVLGPEELAKKADSIMRREWDGLAPEQKIEYEELAEKEAKLQAVPSAQEGPIPDDRQRTAVRMTGVRVERVREGTGRMLFEDGEVFEGGWRNDLPHGPGVVFGHDGLFNGDFVQGRRAGQGTMIYASGEAVTGTFGYRASSTVETRLAAGKGLIEPIEPASGPEYERQYKRMTRLIREYYKEAVQEGQQAAKTSTAREASESDDDGAEQRARALQLDAAAEGEDAGLLGDVVVTKDQPSLTVTADPAESGANTEGAASVPVLDLEKLARPEEAQSADAVLRELEGMDMSARRNAALDSALEGLSLLEEADAYADGVAQGKCRVVFPDGARYEGDMADGVVAGFGVYESSTGTIWKGHFKEGVLHGRGVMKEPSGRIIDGMWELGTAHGLCTEYLPDGSVYDGAFENGLRSGRGILKRSNGDLVQGFWLDGKLHGRVDFIYGNVKVGVVGDSSAKRLRSDHGFSGKFGYGKVRSHGLHFSRVGVEQVHYGLTSRFPGKYARLDQLQSSEERQWRAAQRCVASNRHVSRDTMAEHG